MNDIAHSENKFGGLLVSRRTLTKLSQAHALVGNLRSLFLLRALEESLVNVQPREAVLYTPFAMMQRSALWCFEGPRLQPYRDLSALLPATKSLGF